MAIIPSDQKFHTVPAEVDTKDKGSARSNADREIFTMQDIVDSVTVGGGIDFTELGDTPSVYSGAAGQAAIVNPTEDGLIFGPAGAETLTELTDTPAGYGTNGQVLMTNGSNAATWEDAPSPIGIDTGFITRDAAYSSIGDHVGHGPYDWPCWRFGSGPLLGRHGLGSGQRERRNQRRRLVVFGHRCCRRRACQRHYAAWHSPRQCWRRVVLGHDQRCPYGYGT